MRTSPSVLDCIGNTPMVHLERLAAGLPVCVLGKCEFLILAFSFFNPMYNTLTGIYPSEVFPTEIRGLGTGFATAVSRVGAGLGTFLLPWSMTNLGAGPTMLIAAGIDPRVAQVLAQSLFSLLEGENPTRIEYLWQKVHRAHRDIRGGPFMGKQRSSCPGNLPVSTLAPFSCFPYGRRIAHGLGGIRSLICFLYARRIG